MALVKCLSWGTLAFALMLALFFGVVSLVSGRAFALEQFSDFRLFIVALALGFGVQVGLYTPSGNIAPLAGRARPPAGTIARAS